MKYFTSLRLSLSLPIAFCALSTSALANQHQPPEAKIAEVWVVTVKNGHAEQFEQAFKAHIKQRRDKQDERAWQVYQPVTGHHLDEYVIRYCCLEWKDLDSYRQWTEKSGSGKHWQENVHQHVSSYEHQFSEVDFANSHWPEDDSSYRYYGVTRYYPESGNKMAIEDLKGQFSKHAKDMNWPKHWSWSWNITGKPVLYLVSPFKNYADMAPPEKDFIQMLAEHLKSEDKAMEMLKNWGPLFHKTSYTIYEHIPELSMNAKK